MKFWWSKGPAPGNFGDVLTPYILDHFGIKYRYCMNPRNASALCVGSIAKFARKNTVVLGSGTIRQSDSLDPRADWRFVRGPHTCRIVLENGGQCPEIYGDPALLLPYIQESSSRIHDIGIVPHYVDYQYVKSNYPNHYIINVLREDPLEVAKEISSCHRIVSSSLHGIIAAHSYGIPAAWVEFSNKLSGDRIKFADHFASIGVDNVKSSIDSPVYIDPGYINTDAIIDQFLELR